MHPRGSCGVRSADRYGGHNQCGMEAELALPKCS